MSKSKNDTTGTTYLDIVTFLVLVVENTLSSLPLGRYLLPVTTLNGFPSRGSNRNFSFTTLSENISITRHEIFLVTIPLLDFVMIH